MRLVLDTNVLISALVARGVCADLLEHCVVRYTLVTSDVILAEVRKHLVGKFQYAAQDAEEAVQLFQSHMQVVRPVALDMPVCRDADDDLILGTAVAGQAECVVTGDQDLLVLRDFKGIRILSPREFSDFEEERSLKQP